MGEVLQDVVAVLVPLGVVGFLEVVKVYDDEGIGSCFLGREGGQVLLHVFFHGGLVQHPCEGIGLSLFLVGIPGLLSFPQLLQGILQFLVSLGEYLALALFLPVVMDSENQGGNEQQQDAHGET